MTKCGARTTIIRRQFSHSAQIADSHPIAVLTSNHTYQQNWWQAVIHNSPTGRGSNTHKQPKQVITDTAGSPKRIPRYIRVHFTAILRACTASGTCCFASAPRPPLPSVLLQGRPTRGKLYIQCAVTCSQNRLAARFHFFPCSWHRCLLLSME